MKTVEAGGPQFPPDIGAYLVTPRRAVPASPALNQPSDDRFLPSIRCAAIPAAF